MNMPRRRPEHETCVTQEHYSPTGDTDLAQMLHESGLLFLVNQSVLHNHGLALGIKMDKATGKATGLFVMESADPTGIVFDNDTVERGRKRLRDNGMLRTARLA